MNNTVVTIVGAGLAGCEAAWQLVNRGIPGGCLTPDGHGKGNNKRAVMDPDDGKMQADLITLEVLPNEGAKVGNIYDTDDESFCGCLNQCLRFLQENTRRSSCDWGAARGIIGGAWCIHRCVLSTVGQAQMCLKAGFWKL